MDLTYYFKNISKCSPLLLVGGYVRDFKRFYKGDNMFYLREKKDINNFVDNYSGKRFPGVLVLDLGVGVIPYVDSLLKFVEEYDGAFIVTSAADINNLVFLSRFKVAFRKSMESFDFLLPSHTNTLQNEMLDVTGAIDKKLKLVDPVVYNQIFKGMANGLSLKRVTSCLNILYSKESR